MGSVSFNTKPASSVWQYASAADGIFSNGTGNSTVDSRCHPVWTGVCWRGVWGGPDKILAEGWSRIGLTLAAMIAFALVLESLGFLLSTFFLMILLLRAIESQRWSKVVVVAVLTAIASYAIFGWILGIPLPGGVLGI